MPTEQCRCIYYDPDPDMGEETCACGHVRDEHDERGNCEVDVTW
jgi:hypothetical protein